MSEIVVAYKLTRKDSGAWCHVGTTPQEVSRALKDELDMHEGLSAEECDQITIVAYETTKQEIEALPEFAGW